MKNTVTTFLNMKQEGKKITELTCYDYMTAKLVDSSGINAILVGDSLGNTVLGYEDTLSVTMEDMIHHGKAVSRGCKNAMVIIDMPFMSYQTSVYDALVNAGRLMKEGRGTAVKLEGGKNVADKIKAITNAGIPVQAHIGMTPQSVNAFGGFYVQGKGEEAARQLIEDAYIVQEAGAFSVVLECCPPKLSKLISEKLTIPTIGIGAGAGCDGQVLVYQDMLGMQSSYLSPNGFVPKFVKQYANVGDVMVKAFQEYINEVQNGIFPSAEYSYVKSDCNEEFLQKLSQEYF
ncbi:MAG: 3-methyl-2-oxobutanoate hydroxymethyltransferase [Epulopiscium sp. Nuni2H_MBin003]|nr:MAG: 3-methyl-2-oxobutanoate hydroxymethyltransferase [Epulopiscium sp. Nuni2H_MBin003]